MQFVSGGALCMCANCRQFPWGRFSLLISRSDAIDGGAAVRWGRIRRMLFCYYAILECKHFVIKEKIVCIFTILRNVVVPSSESGDEETTASSSIESKKFTIN